jgi:hypothetical protein
MKKLFLALIILPLSLTADEPLIMWIVNNCGKPIQFIIHKVPLTLTQGAHTEESFIDWGFAIPTNGQPKKISFADIDGSGGRWAESFLHISQGTSCSVCVPNKNGVGGVTLPVPIKDRAAYRVRYDRDQALVEELDKSKVQLSFD